MMKALTEPKTRRAPGRPGRISSEQIVAATLSMLEVEGLDGFTMAKVARRVGVTVMALYNYFPGRDALLDAAAQAIFKSFEAPCEDCGWEEGLVDWMNAVLALFERHPVGLKLIKWDEHITPSWLRILLPMVKILAMEGLEEERLAIVSTLISQMAMGLVFGRLRTFETGAASSFLNLEVTSDEAQTLLDSLARNVAAAHSRKAFDLGVRSLVNMLREEIMLVRAAASADTDNELRKSGSATRSKSRPARSKTPRDDAALS